MSDLIAAIATGSTAAAIGIVRVFGDWLLCCLRPGLSCPGTESPSPSSPLTRWCSEKCWTIPTPSSIRD